MDLGEKVSRRADLAPRSLGCAATRVGHSHSRTGRTWRGLHSVQMARLSFQSMKVTYTTRSSSAHRPRLTSPPSSHLRRWQGLDGKLRTLNSIAPLQLQEASTRHQVLTRRKVSKPPRLPICPSRHPTSSAPLSTHLLFVQVHRRYPRLARPGLADALPPRPRVRPVQPPPHLHRPLRRCAPHRVE